MQYLIFFLTKPLISGRVEKSWQHGQQADGTFGYFMHFSEQSGLNLAGGSQVLFFTQQTDLFLETRMGKNINNNMSSRDRVSSVLECSLEQNVRY